MNKVIFHVDVNSAFLSWSAVERLSSDPAAVDLRTIPSAVGGDIETRHGIITAKSIPAKAYHIETGEPVVSALKKCPGLVLVPADFAAYRRHSRELMDLLRKYAPTVFQFSIDEAFLDMTGTELLYGDPVDFAHHLKDEIRDTLGFTVNVGVSSNMLLAKMASDFQKPDRVHTLFPEEVPEKMWPLPVGDLFSVGRATAEKLTELGIRSIGDLAHTDPAVLTPRLKSYGALLVRYANGEGPDDVASAGRSGAERNYSNETTLSHDVTDPEEARLVLLSLAETVGQRIRADQKKASVIQVYYKDNTFSVHSRQRTLSHQTDSTDEIYETAHGILSELWHGQPMRLLGIALGKAGNEAPEQLTLFGSEDRARREKLHKLDQSLDLLRNRYGKDAVQRASLAADRGKPKK